MANATNEDPAFNGRICPPTLLYYLTPKEKQYAAARFGIDDAVAWTSKSPLMVPHDRAITLVHLALDNGFGPRFGGWLQQGDDVKESVTIHGERINFFADGVGNLDETFLWLEYTRANAHAPTAA